MAKTPLTSQTPFITVQQLIVFCDVRTLSDYISDTGARGDVLVSGTIGGLLYELMLAATGDLESVAYVAGAYIPDDFAALIANGGAAAARLRKMVAGMTLMELFARRPTKVPPKIQAVEDAEAWLTLLGTGERIFGFQETADAGLPEVQIEDAADRNARNMTTRIARRFFGRRQSDYPQG